MGSVPGLVQLRIRHCCSYGLGRNCASDVIPGPGAPHTSWQPKVTKKKGKGFEETFLQRHSKHMKSCSMSSAIGEMQIKTAVKGPPLCLAG